MMARWDDDEPFFRPERPRSEVVSDKLATIGFDWDDPSAKIGGQISDPPEVTERKRQETAERLRRHDALFDVWPGCTMGVPPPWEAADETDNPD